MSDAQRDKDLIERGCEIAAEAEAARNDAYRREVDFDNAAFYSFRYCLGRQTYAVDDCVGILTRNWNRLTSATQYMIKEEITKAFAQKRYGSEIDREAWASILGLSANPITQDAASPKAGLPTTVPADCPASSPESGSESVSSDTPASPSPNSDDMCERCGREYPLPSLTPASVPDVHENQCVWAVDEDTDSDHWETTCGNAFQFEEGGPTENGLKFCGYCSKPLVEWRSEVNGN